MFDIGFMELVVLAIVAMLVVGPERLPEAARAAGKTVGKLKRFFSSIQKQIDQELRADELNKINQKIMDDTNGEIFAMNDAPAAEPPKKVDAPTPDIKSEPTQAAAKTTENHDNRKVQ